MRPAAGLARPIDGPDALLEAIHAREPRAPFTGRAALRVVEAGRKQSVTLSFLFAPPARLRGDAVTAFGIPVGTFVVSGDRVAMFEHGTNRFIEGDAGAPEARSVLPIPVRPSELMALLTGIPPLRGFSAEPGTYSADAEYGYLSLRNAEGRRIGLKVGLETGLVRDILFLPEGVRLQFGDYRETEGGAVPAHVTVSTPGADDGLTAEARLSDWSFRPQVDASSFILDAPPGAERYRLGRGESQE